MPLIHWICGWASDLEPWRSQIIMEIPDFEHRIYAFDQWFDQDLIFDGIVIPWSMGLQGSINPQAQVIALFPAVDFCGSSGWSQRSIQRMIKQFRIDPLQVLGNFAQLMGIPQSDAPIWIQKAAAMDRELLIHGLEQLAKPLDHEHLPKQGHFIHASEDRISFSSQMDELRLRRWKESQIQGEHWPITPSVLQKVGSLLRES